MRVELPELKRCCFCMPLRHGLITWGYIRLITVLFFAVLLTSTLVRMCLWYMNYPGTYSGIVMDIIMISLFVTALMFDIAFTIIFIIGGHRKSARLLHIYYIYCLVMLCIDILFFIGVSIMDIITIHHYMTYASDIPVTPYLFYIRTRLVLGIALIGIQVYTILLIRSEENKLRDTSKFRFGNPILEASGPIEDAANKPEEDSTEVEQQTDAQFEAVIDQTHSVHNENYTYRKF